MDDTRHWLIIGPYCWGKGTTRQAALKNARRNLPRTARQFKKWIVYRGPEAMFVDDMGSVCWPSEGERPERVE